MAMCSIAWSGAVPMLLARRDPHRVAGADLADRPAPGLDPADARRDVQRLAERMRVPGRARARLEADPGRAQPRRVGRLDDGILPDGPGETRRAHLARGARSACEYVHRRSPPNAMTSR